MATEEPRRLISTIERAADVLRLFTNRDNADLGVTEIANHLGLSKAVVHRVLTTLAAKGFVETDEVSRRYRLGPTALALGVAYLDRIDIRTLARPRLQELSERTSETATLSLRYGWERMYVEQVTPNREVKMTVALAHAFPLHAGSSSKALLAFLPEEDQETYLAKHRLEALTDSTIRDVEELRRDLAAVRSRGYAISFGERQPGASSVAAPVLDHQGQPAAAVSICGPLERFRDKVEENARLLLKVTGDLSRQLGHQDQHAS